MALAFAGFAIKMFIKKDGEFKKQCSSIDPDTGKALGCTCEGQPSDGSCRNEDETSKSAMQIRQLQTEL